MGNIRLCQQPAWGEEKNQYLCSFQLALNPGHPIEKNSGASHSLFH